MQQVKILDAQFSADTSIFEGGINRYLEDGWKLLSVDLVGSRWVAVLLREDDDEARVIGKPVASFEAAPEERKPTRKPKAKEAPAEELPEPPAEPDMGGTTLVAG